MHGQDRKFKRYNYIAIQCKSMINALWNNNQIATNHFNSNPLIISTKTEAQYLLSFMANHQTTPNRSLPCIRFAAITNKNQQLIITKSVAHLLSNIEISRSVNDKANFFIGMQMLGVKCL